MVTYLNYIIANYIKLHYLIHIPFLSVLHWDGTEGMKGVKRKKPGHHCVLGMQVCWG